MTRNDYIALAAVFKATKPVFTGDKDSAEYLYFSFDYGQWEKDVAAVIKLCAKSDPHFREGKFLTACGLPNIREK